MLGQDSLADNIMAGRRLSKRLTARTVETLASPADMPTATGFT